ncbi:hypothetical protein D9M68_491230 [compost metagenome]
MNSASARVSTAPPVSWLARPMAAITSSWVMPRLARRTGSSTTWYCLTMPPTVATSATLGNVFSSNLRNQSCRARSCARSCPPLRSTRAYWKIQPTPVASGPSAGLAVAGSRPWTWLRYSSTRERAQ